MLAFRGAGGFRLSVGGCIGVGVSTDIGLFVRKLREGAVDVDIADRGGSVDGDVGE
jgi:hypothetical protein